MSQTRELPDPSTSAYAPLLERIENGTALAGVIGLGYVGLPLAAGIGRAGLRTVGFDIDPLKAERLNRGESYIDAVPGTVLADLIAEDKFSATADFSRLADCDVIIICVPTPLGGERQPDLSFIRATAREIAAHLRPGQLIALESTTYPGTTQEVLRTDLEKSGLKAGEDFFIGYSPEREDPGNALFTTTAIPKIISGDGPEAGRLMSAFYDQVFEKTVPVSSTSTAEAVKITENVFRAVNIALVNELKMVFDAMDIDIWEVIEAAKTKPFGYMPFYPGPGLGGHCIPIDPFYLTWKAREYDVPTRFIELAGEINHHMPHYVINRLQQALRHRSNKPLMGARVLMVGLAYKKNVSDTRESPTFRLIEILEQRGAEVSYHDPHVPEVPPTRDHPELAGRLSVALEAATLKGLDAVVICTDHDDIDYRAIAESGVLTIDTRNAFSSRGIETGASVIKS